MDSDTPNPTNPQPPVNPLVPTQPVPPVQSTAGNTQPVSPIPPVQTTQPIQPATPPQPKPVITTTRPPAPGSDDPFVTPKERLFASLASDNGIQPHDVIAQKAEAAKANTGPQKKILIVEDERDLRKIFIDLLELGGYEVSSAVDGKDALAKAAADRFDLILLDIVMPNMDGLEVLRIIKSHPEKYGNPIIVMLSNISGDIAVKQAMEMGAAGFKLKAETDPGLLLEEIEKFLAGKIQNIELEPVSRSLF